MALPCVDSDGPKPKTEYDADADADVDDDTDVPSAVDVAMHDVPPAATTKARPGGGGAGSKAGGRTTKKGGIGKRSTASSVRGGVRGGGVRGGVRGGGNKKKSRPASPFVKPEPGLTPSSSGGGHEASDSEDDKRGVAAGRVEGKGGDGNGNGNGSDDDPSPPSSSPSSSSNSDDDNSASDNGPYCICRGPDDHRWMIQCDNCEDWFHGDCVQLDKEQTENLIVSYICPNCVIPDLYISRFRKLCSLPGCRKPARLYAATTDNPADGPAAAAPGDASAFCSEAHRDQWWEVLLERMVREAGSGGGGGGTLKEDKLPVDQLTPAQLVAVLAHSSEPDVARMLLHGLLAPDSSADADADADTDTDALLSAEERTITDASAAERYRLAAQVAMCKKMLLLLDMAKTRHQEATKAGHLERDGCGYDERLQHVGVQPHFAQFLRSPEGRAIFGSARTATANDSDSDTDTEHLLNLRLGPPRFDTAGQPVDADSMVEGEAAAATTATAGLCHKRKCKAHAGWFPTLARDVRMQIHECTRQAAALRDKETRIRLAAGQRAFVMQHSTSEVRRFATDDGRWSDPSSPSDDDGGGHAAREQQHPR